ncbi:olfactory receptor 2AT4-like [Betta splendens]|uniref:Olfactory receptor 2AT4-like n=1 Tax=Betta splendens TaxID=158456 RepID=A0A6P7PDA0_BETSP|nr:olfactory receptor 2AT4-like [Betta splendens]
MSNIKSAVNSSEIIRPPGFYIIGFQSFPFISVYFIFLAFVYVVTLLFNALVIYTVALNGCLHTPKFVAVVNLAFIDVILNSSTIPGMMKIFLFKENFVPFDLCLVQMFVYYTSASLESFALAILAYDRLVAICFPLRQNSLNTLRSMSYIISVTWCFTLGICAFAIGIMTQLSFCKSVNVYGYFCDYLPVFTLACNDYSLHWYLASTLFIMILGGPFIFIFLSYISILVTVFRMKSIDSRVKALATCVEHLILVALYYIPLSTIFSVQYFSVRPLDVEQWVLSLSLASCLPPCVNPIVYSFRTKEIRVRALALIRAKKTGIDVKFG